MGDHHRRMLRGGFAVHVDRDPDEVFAYLVDIERTPEWRDNLSEVMWIDGGQVRPGRRLRALASFAWWRDLTMVGRVTTHDPVRRRFAYEIVEGPPARVTNEYVVEPHGDGSLVTMTGTSEVPGALLRLAGPLLERRYARMLRPQVQRLRMLLEQREDLRGR